ncbi:MAG: DUF1844 domain-containing protein [Blastocatellia bacterium]
MEDQNPNDIKVVDRRMFNADGSLRDDVSIAEPEPEPEPVVIAQAAQAPAQLVEEEEEYMDGMPEEGEMNEFMEFLMQISSSAFIYLGMMEHPATGQRQVNPPAARQSIDMLLMLRGKVKGNLTRQEEQFFDGLLSDLQMQYVALTNRMSGMGR